MNCLGPVGLNLEKTIRGAKKYILRRRAVHARRGENVVTASTGTVIIVLAPTATMSQNVLEGAKEEFRIFKPVLPGMEEFNRRGSEFIYHFFIGRRKICVCHLERKRSP